MRALRKIADDTKNHDLERDLYIEERKAELGVYFPQLRGPWGERLSNATRRVEHGFRIIVMALYWALANYGRSSVLPLAWLFGSGFAFYRGYLWILAPMMSKVNPLDVDKYKRAVGMLALGNAVPFVGPVTIDAEIKKFLFCAGEVSGKCVPLPPEGFQ